MKVSLSFDLPLEGAGSVRPKGAVVRALTMRLCLDEHCVDYGECPTIEYYTDLCEEIHKTTDKQDHRIEFSGYPVGEVLFLPNNVLKIAIYTSSDVCEGMIPVPIYLQELKRGRDTLETLMGLR